MVLDENPQSKPIYLLNYLKDTGEFLLLFFFNSSKAIVGSVSMTIDCDQIQILSFLSISSTFAVLDLPRGFAANLRESKHAFMSIYGDVEHVCLFNHNSSFFSILATFLFKHVKAV